MKTPATLLVKQDISQPTEINVLHIFTSVKLFVQNYTVNQDGQVDNRKLGPLRICMTTNEPRAEYRWATGLELLAHISDHQSLNRIKNTRS